MDEGRACSHPARAFAPSPAMRPAAAPSCPTTTAPVVLCSACCAPTRASTCSLEAWRGIEGAELWVVGTPRIDTAPLHAAAPPSVRFVERFVTDARGPRRFPPRRLVVLPYREIDQSGVLFTALAFGAPLVLSDVGGFPEVAADGAASSSPPGDAAALRDALARLLADPARRASAGRWPRCAAAASAIRWDAIARAHLELYDSLLR